MEYIGYFSGGGIKGLSFIGSIIALEERGFICKRCAGTSAGAIFGSLVASGYTGKELLKLAYNTDFTEFFKPNKGFTKVKNLGISSMKNFEYYLNSLYLEKNVRTFKDLYLGNDYKLKVIATNLFKMKKLVLPTDLKNYNINPLTYPVSKAVLMSSSLPLIFEPIKINNQIIVDGGLKEKVPNVEFNSNLPKIYFVFDDKEYLDGYTIKIDLPKVKTTEFDLKLEKVKELVKSGYIAGMKFINKYFDNKL